MREHSCISCTFYIATLNITCIFLALGIILVLFRECHYIKHHDNFYYFHGLIICLGACSWFVLIRSLTVLESGVWSVSRVCQAAWEPRGQRRAGGEVPRVQLLGEKRAPLPPPTRSAQHLWRQAYHMPLLCGQYRACSLYSHVSDRITYLANDSVTRGFNSLCWRGNFSIVLCRSRSSANTTYALMKTYMTN